MDFDMPAGDVPLKKIPFGDVSPEEAIDKEIEQIKEEHKDKPKGILGAFKKDKSKKR